jgi:hypothetical protein
MPDQKEHEKPESLVETPGLAEEAARSLQDAASSHATLEGFLSVNNERFSPELEKEAEADQPKNGEKGHPVP